MIWFSGTVIQSMTTTAAPRPIAVSTFLDTARNEHMPRKNDNARFSTNTAFAARLR